MSTDNLGDRMKSYEEAETGRKFMQGLPIVVRIDGRNFSTLTRYMERPYDTKLMDAMVLLTHKLVEETNAVVGYTQSDEISLVLYQDDPKSQIYFGGRIFKIVSALSGFASANFVHYCNDRIILPSVPTFDCRAYQVPTKEEAANAILWRVNDATKNAISMAARTVYSHNALQSKSGKEMQGMMLEKNINFNDYPEHFKRGSFVIRRKQEVHLEPEILKKIPSHKRPNGPVMRNVIEEVSMPIFSRVQNRVGVIFNQEEPQVVEE